MLAAFAGTCASLASVSSKLALEDGGKTLRYVVPCSLMTGAQCAKVRLAYVKSELHPLFGSVAGSADNPGSVYYPDASLQCYHVECVCQSPSKVQLNRATHCHQQCFKFLLHGELASCMLFEVKGLATRD